MKTTEKVAEKKEQPIPMSQFVDRLVLKGGNIDEITKKLQAEAKKRDVKTLSTKGQIVSHVRYRISKGVKIKLDGDTVTLTK